MAVEYSDKFTDSIDPSLENAVRQKGGGSESGIIEQYKDDSSKLLGIGYINGNMTYSCFVNTFSNGTEETDIVQLYNKSDYYLFDGEEDLFQQ